MVLAPHMAFSQKSKQITKEPEAVLELWQVDTLINPIPLNRSMFTDNIMKQVAEADRKDGALDQVIETDDSTVSRIVTEAMLQRLPRIMTHIENMNLSHQQKIYYHKALGNMARRLNQKSLQPENALYIRKSVENFEELLLAREQNRVMEYVRANDNIYTLDNSELLDEYPDAKMLVFTSVGNAYPEMMIKRLPSFAMESYADPVIAAAAKVLPGTILTYATSTSALSTAVRRNKDPLVKSIVRIANESKAPLKALPFLEEVNSGRKTVAEIDVITADPKAYFQALVGLKMQGKSVSDRAIDQELEIRGLQFVRVVNELHDEPAPVRFKSLMDFNAEDLYFMMIGSQQEIYTSSFVWMCKRMMEKMKPASGDELLNRVHKSHFRTFIRMCAGYNMLSDFLATIGEEQKTALMREFVANLHEGPFDNLEDAVDVADAFGSIADQALIAFLKEEVRKNYELKINAKGIIVYGLLSTIFNSAENAEALNEDVKDLIPPITFVPGSSLRNEEGAVIEHVFFYGDKDGMGAYANYIRNFNNNKWKVEQNEYWATITSTGPNKVVIYANRPLPEEEGLDEIAQKKLAAHLREQNITPTIIIHRGHSYFLPTTLEYLSPETKIVILGSCGGYHNLSKVLNTAQDAHIISSKQVGALNVNMPIINAIDNQLLAGKDVNWIEMWAGLRKYFDGRGAVERDLFSDYIPPNKNLGAIFIKAYRKQAMILEGFQ
jgi:hypothetical protein